MKENLTGRKIGEWQVIACHNPPVNKHYEIEWDCICPICGSIVQKTYYNLMKRPAKGCRNCRGVSVAHDLTNRKFGRLTPIKYHGTNNGNGAVWECLCDCGNKTIVQAGSLKLGKVKSCGCWNTKQLQNPKKDLSGKTYGYLNIISYTGRNGSGGSIWNALCTKCGNTIEVSRHDLVTMNRISCGCVKSKSETYILKYLKDNNICFKKEYSFNDLKSIKGMPLRFDFAIFDDLKQLKFLIEYQGEQHFYSAEYFGGEEKFLLGQKYDNMKREYCKRNNIKLYEIPYYDDLELKLQEIFYDNQNIA